MKTFLITIYLLFASFSYAFSKPLDGIKICIDSGHGGDYGVWYDERNGNILSGPSDPNWQYRHRGDSGAVGSAGLEEADETLVIANKLKTLLASSGGATVEMTRESNVYLSLDARAQYANSKNVDWFISVHLNSTGDTVTNYTRVLYYPDTTDRNIKSKEMSTVMQEHQYRLLSIPQSGPIGANIAVLRETQMPANLSESVFISCASEEILLNTSDAREQTIAQAIFNGIVDYFTPPMVQKVFIKQNNDMKYTAYWQNGTGARNLNETLDKSINGDVTPLNCTKVCVRIW